MGISKRSAILRNRYDASGKRVTPPEDYDRFARNIYGIYGNDIYDVDSYNKAFDEYMGDDLHEGWDKDLRKEGFYALKKIRPSIIGEHLGGVSPEEYKEGQRPDRRRLRKAERFNGGQRKYVFVGNIYDKELGIKKDVYAREDKVTYNYKSGPKERIIYRDRKGRFVKRL